MGIFEDLGISSDQVNLPEYEKIKLPATYPGVIKWDGIIHGSKNDDTYLAYGITYKLENVPFDITERFSLPKTKGPWDNTIEIGKRNNGEPITEDSQNKFFLGLFKQRLLGIGVPESKVNGIGPGDLTGIEVVVDLVDNNGFANVKRSSDAVRPRRNQGLSLPQAQTSGQGVQDAVTNIAQQSQQSAFKPAWG